MKDASNHPLGGSFKATFSLPLRGVSTWCEHGKGHQGAPGSISPTQPERKIEWWLQQPALSSAEFTKKKCVQREVCFATDVPGSVARTGCTSLFWKHVWAPDSLFPPEISACRNSHRRYRWPRNNICRSKWSRYNCQQTFTSFRYPSFCFHCRVNSSPWIGNS